MWGKAIAAMLVAGIFVFAMAGCGSNQNDYEKATKGLEDAVKTLDTGKTSNSSSSSSSSTAVSSSSSVAATSTAPTATTAQTNALRTAKNYLATMPFSHDGLVSQLEYEGYSNADAVYAADNCGADWNAQAAKAAKQYNDMMGFSREGLIEQLVYEGYTESQAAYGADSIGL